MSKKITGNFVCENCGSSSCAKRNHCSHCLWSKHLNKSGCGALMKPKKIWLGMRECVIGHTCQGCGAEERHATYVNDSFDALIELARQNENGLEAQSL